MTKTRVQAAELPTAQALPLSADTIHALSEQWSASTGDKQAWDDIAVLADAFFASGEDQRVSAWHHLLMAVGNFKRSAGLILPEPLPSGVGSTSHPTSFSIPETARIDGTLSSADEPTWRRLADIPGLAVPTAATLLSALWPGEHIIIDRRDATAATALSLSSDSLAGKQMPKDLDWPWYHWLRATVMATATDQDVEPVEVERALYVLYKQTKQRPPPDGTWGAYRGELEPWIS